MHLILNINTLFVNFLAGYPSKLGILQVDVRSRTYLNTSRLGTCGPCDSEILQSA